MVVKSVEGLGSTLTLPSRGAFHVQRTPGGPLAAPRPPGSPIPTASRPPPAHPVSRS